MMGRLKDEQEQLFYEFRLDEVVPDLSPGSHAEAFVAAAPPSISGLMARLG